MRFDLLNLKLTEPIDIPNCQCSAYPEFKRILLYPSQWRRFSLEPHRPSDAVAFLEIDEQSQNELALQRRGEEYMIWVCWLLSLAQLHDVYYWGSHHFGKVSSQWKWYSSGWKTTLVREWKPRRENVFEGNVLYWRLPDFLPTGLKRYADPSFSLKDFIRALHLFLDSLPIRQLAETRLIRKWIAFEKLANEQARSDGYLYVFGKEGSEEFAGLRDRLEETVKSDPSVIARPDAEQPLKSHLPALERLPVKMLSCRFLDELKIKYDPKTLKRIVNTRNKIFHYLDAGIDAKEMWELGGTLDYLLSEILCRKLGWDREGEFQKPYSEPFNEPLPDYVELRSQPFRNEANGTGWLEAEDGTRLLECRGSLSWRRDEVRGRLRSADALKLLQLPGQDMYLTVRLDMEDGNSLLVERAKLDCLQGTIGSRPTLGTTPDTSKFEIVGLRVYHTHLVSASS